MLRSTIALVCVIALHLCICAEGLSSETGKPIPLPLPAVEAVSSAKPTACESENFILPVQHEETGGSLMKLSFQQFSGPTRNFTMLRDSSYLLMGNDFTSIPAFEGGIIVEGENIALKIGGYIKADMIKDFDAIDSTDRFDTTMIPTSGPTRENARFHARQSRLSFDTRWKANGDIARIFVEADFFGGEPNNSNFRLRHAYGEIGQFTAGQTWTTFTDPSAVPQTLDNEGAVSNVNRRQGLVRWDQPIWNENFSLAFALENPRISVESPSMAMGEGRTEFPDFISRLRYDRDWGEFQTALVLRTLGFQPNGEPVLSENGWGFNFTGSILVLDETKAYYQITFGEGIGSYRGSPDVVATGPDTASILPLFGWLVGVHHEWSDSLTSNFTFSELALEDLPGQDPDNLLETRYLAANLIANPYRNVFCGIEYLYGIRKDVSGAEGNANRVQISFGYKLP